MEDHQDVKGGNDLASRDLVTVALTEVLALSSNDRERDLMDLVMGMRLSRNEVEFMRVKRNDKVSNLFSSRISYNNG